MSNFYKFIDFGLKGATLAILLTACSGNIREAIPDRRPDYRQSKIGNQLEVPPSLTANSLDDQLAISDLNPQRIATYNAYDADQVIRNKRGYIEVLPELHAVTVVENNNSLPLIIVDADANTAWSIVEKYWRNNGINLITKEAAIGIMETDWLENKADLPKGGIGAMLGSVFSVLTDTSERDQYRLRFSKINEMQTQIMIIHRQAVEKTRHSFASGKDPAGFTWQLADNDNPELQLEMTRRIALYISAQLRHKYSNAATGEKTQLITTEDDILLAIASDYAQTWRILEIALDNAGFSIEESDYRNGAYLARLIPTTDDNKQSFWSKLKFWKDAPVKQHPAVQIRVADQGEYCLIAAQDESGNKLATEDARVLLQNLKAAI